MRRRAFLMNAEALRSSAKRLESPELTIFAAPKAFSGHFGIIQDNAIRSWKQLQPAPRIILFVDETGVAHVAKRLQVQQVSDVATNSHGTPLVSDMFRQADALASGHSLA